MLKLLTRTRPYMLSVAAVVAILASLISLSLSEVLGWTPCLLCWYQRIFMYPLAFILTVAAVYKDRFVHRYLLPLSIIGAAIAFYHSLLQWGLVSESLAPCRQGVSCVVRHTAWFGFVTIPFLSFIAFSVITILMLAYARGNKDE